MAEITNASDTKGSAGRPGVKKFATKIDMTPMVDLAFLLLTFFILTTVFNKPHVMEVTMPDRSGPTSPVNEERVLQLVLSGDDRIFWWTGSGETIAETNYASTGIRQVIFDRLKKSPGTVVLIKPAPGSRYGNLVDILDEMTITGASKFAVVDFTTEDASRIADLN